MNKEINKLRALFPKIPKEKPLTYKIYDYLKKNAVGYKNRVKSDIIMKEFEIADNKTLRKYIQEIRESEILTKIVCSEAGNKGGYWLATNNEDIEKTLTHLYRRSMEMLKNYSIIKKKARLNNQMRIKLSKYEKNIIESIMKEEK